MVTCLGEREFKLVLYFEKDWLNHTIRVQVIQTNLKIFLYTRIDFSLDDLTTSLFEKPYQKQIVHIYT